MLRLWPWLLASIFCAGIIHILAVFGVPYLASRDAWARLSEISEENRINVLSVAASDTPLPFMAPDIAHAFCRYDLTNNNVLVKTSLGDGTWSIAVSGRHGENFYFISGAEAKRRELRLLLVPRSRLAEEVSTERSEEGDEQIIVITPGMEGWWCCRAPIRGPEFRGRYGEGPAKRGVPPRLRYAERARRCGSRARRRAAAAEQRALPQDAAPAATLSSSARRIGCERAGRSAASALFAAAPARRAGSWERE